MRGLRHGPAPEAPQPLAHGPPGLHPAVGLQTSPAPGRPSLHTASFQDFPPHWPRALGPRATLSASVPRAPGLVAARLRPARTWAPSEAPHAPVLSSRAAEQPGRSPDRGRPETKAQEADRPSPAPDAAGSRPRCGRHRASQLRPPCRSRPRQLRDLRGAVYIPNPHLRRLSCPQRWRLGRRPWNTSRKAAAVYFQSPCLRHTRVCTRPHTRRCARLASASPTRPISAGNGAGQSEAPAGSAV